MLDLIAELIEIERAEWPLIQAGIPDWHPRNEGDDAGDDDDAGGTDDTGDDDDDAGDDAGGEERGEDYWRSRARQHERAARRERKAREAIEKTQREREDATKSAQERAVQAARDEGEKTAREAAEKERRADRLETATIRIASRGLKVKDGEEERTVRFADPDDAHTYIERMVRRGDLDEDDVFDDEGKVNTDALSEALVELVSSKPHLVAEGNGKPRKVKGSADGGKGSGGGEPSELSTEQWLSRIRDKEKATS